MWTIFKVFIEFVTILLLFYVLFFFWFRGMWDLSSPTRDQTQTPCIGRRSLNYWTTRKAPGITLSIKGILFLSGCIFCFLWFPKGKCNMTKRYFCGCEDNNDFFKKPQMHCPSLIGLNWRAGLPRWLFWNGLCYMPAYQLVVIPYDLPDGLDSLVWHSFTAVAIFCLTVNDLIVFSPQRCCNPDP